jgi:type I restriction enzyme S subunit
MFYMKMNKVKLGDVLDVKRGASIKGEFYATEGDMIRLTLGNFNYPGGGFKPNTSKDDIYYTGPVQDEFIMNKGDIITPLTEQVAGLLGETARIPESGKYIQNGDIGKVIPNEEKLDNSYAYYLMASPSIKRQLGAAAQQTKIRHTSPDKIKDCVAWLPTLDYQYKAGKLLDSINDKIDNNNAISKQLEEAAKTIYDYWLLQFDFPDENGNPYRSSGGKMVWNDELKREIPEGWKVGSLYDIANFINGLACQKHRPTDNNHKLPVVKIKEMHDGYTKETEYVSNNIPEKNIINNGDILFSWSATLETMIWNGGKAGLNQHIFKVVPKTGYSKYYVYEQLAAYIINFRLIAEARKTTMGHITTDHLKQSRIVLPRHEVINLFSDKISPFFDELSKIKIENQQLASLRDFLLPLLMNGQVTFKED